MLPPAVVGVLEVQRIRTAALGNGVNERSSGVRSVCRSSLRVAVLRRVSCAIGYCALSYSVQLVVGVVDLCAVAAVVLDLRYTVVSIVGILGPVRFVVGSLAKHADAVPFCFAIPLS